MTAHTATCREQPDIQGYLDNQLTLPERLRFERHVKDCRTCNRALDEYRRLFAGLDDVCSPTSADDPSAGRIDQVMKRLPTTRPPVSVAEEPRTVPFWQLWFRPFAIGVALCVTIAGWVLTSRFRPAGPAPDAGIHQATHQMPMASPYAYSFLPVPGKPGSIEKSDGGTVSPQGTLEPGAAYRLPAAGTLFVSFAGTNRLEFTRGAQFSAVASGVTLLSGQVLCDLQPQASGFTITTPAGSIAVRGTRFTVEVTVRGTEVRLDRGVVELQTSRHRERLSTAGTRLLTPEGAIITPVSQPATGGAGTTEPTSPANLPVPQDPANTAGNLNQGF